MPEVEFEKLTDAQKAKFTSTKNLLLCENHFEASQFNVPSEKGDSFFYSCLLFWLVLFLQNADWHFALWTFLCFMFKVYSSLLRSKVRVKGSQALKNSRVF